MEISKLIDMALNEFGLWVKHKKQKQYYVAQVYKGRCEVWLELLLGSGYEPRGEGDCVSYMLKAIRGF